MKLSISNIAWSAADDGEMYTFLKQSAFTGLEVAPTRLFPKEPYSHIEEAKYFSQFLNREYNLCIPSMQSILYGRTENLFGGVLERDTLMNYTKKAILFAEAMGCHNLVFGCPRNRYIVAEDKYDISYSFFTELGQFAQQHNSVIALEPNPACYGTNFINTTRQAFLFCKNIGSKGVKVNVDLGTMLYYGEPVSLLYKHLDLVNHIHISCLLYTSRCV